MTQKQFVIGLIENEIERDLTQRAAMSEALTDSKRVVEEHAEQRETAAVGNCESVSEEQESTDFSDDFDGESEEYENPDEYEDLDESEDQDESEEMGMSLGM